MNTHDIELPPLPKSGWALNHENAFTANDMKAYARAAIEADRKQQADWHRIADERAAEIVRLTELVDRKRRFQNGEALKRYKECGADEEQDPIERLRFFCSLAMSGRDWLDSEQFFDDLIADRKRRGEPVGIVKRPSEAHYPGVQWLTDVKDGDQLYTAQSGGGDGS